VDILTAVEHASSNCFHAYAVTVLTTVGWSGQSWAQNAAIHGGSMILRYLNRLTTSSLIFAGCFSLSAPALGLPASSCTPTFTSCDVYEDGNILQLRGLAIAGDVVLLDAPSSISDVFRIFNNVVNTGGGTGLGNEAFLFSVDEGNLPSASSLSVNAVFVPEGTVAIGGLVETDFVGNGTTYRIFSAEPTAALEPPMLALLGIGLAGLGFAHRKRKQ
jgi:hypothetical protein